MECISNKYWLPRHIHVFVTSSIRYVITVDSSLAFSADETEMRVTWVTRDTTDNPEVGYGQTNLAEYSAKATKLNFTDGGSAQRSIFVYTATMISLKPGKGYGMIPRFIVWMLLMIFARVKWQTFCRCFYIYLLERKCLYFLKIKFHWNFSLRFQLVKSLGGVSLFVASSPNGFSWQPIFADGIITLILWHT